MKRTNVLLNEKITPALVDEYNNYSEAIDSNYNYAIDLNNSINGILKYGMFSFFSYDSYEMYDRVRSLLIKLSLFKTYDDRVKKTNTNMMDKFIEEIDLHTAIEAAIELSDKRFDAKMIFIRVSMKLKLFNLLNRLIYRIKVY